MPARIIEPRRIQIDGQTLLMFDQPSPLPPSLPALLARLRVTFRADVRPTGARQSCEVAEADDRGVARDHRLVRFREGRWMGPDGVVRDLRLLMCADCEAVCVRDISIDRIEDLDPTGMCRLGRRAPQRRNKVLGWYTGARPRQREYR